MSPGAADSDRITPIIRGGYSFLVSCTCGQYFASTRAIPR